MNDIPLTYQEMLLLASPFITIGFGIIIASVAVKLNNDTKRSRRFKEAKKSGFLK